MLRAIAADAFVPVLSLGELDYPEFLCHLQIWPVLTQKPYHANSDQISAPSQRFNVPWAIEFPEIFCMTSQLQELSEMRNVYKMTFCAFGTKWRKRTTVLASHVDSADVWALDTMRCRGHKWCSVTGEKHMQLVGDGPFHQCSRTHRSRIYPIKLASRLANLLFGTNPHRPNAENML